MNLTLHRLPFWIKKLTASALLRMLKTKYLEDDVILYNELNAWIDTNGKPTTTAKGAP